MRKGKLRSHPLYPPSPSGRVRAAWQTQMAAAVRTPGLLPELVQRRSELLPRFSAYYTQLQALPRRVRRALQRRWRLPIAGVALLLALGQWPVQAATIPVGAGCTLVDAITAANTDTATGGCTAGSGADTIELPPGSTHTLTAVNNSTYGGTGLPVISSTITIAGQGSTITKASGMPEFRIIAVGDEGDLTLQETTVSGADGVYINGAGVLNAGGTVTITNSTISNNYTYGEGGGVFNGPGGTVTITNSTISDNDAIDSASVVNREGLLTIADSVISDNNTAGIFNVSGTVTITNSTISGNLAFDGTGGGVRNTGTGAMTIANSTIAGNRATYGGGGLFNNFVATITITNSTISDNSNDVVGGSGLLNSGTMTVTNSTIINNREINAGYGGGINNRRGSLVLVRTLVAGNIGPDRPSGSLEIFNDVTQGATVMADNHNLFGLDGNAGVEGFSPGSTDVVPSSGVLLPDIVDPTLAHNGGPTQTHALVPGSPAIDAGDAACTDADGNPLVTDQRGETRPVDGDGDGQAACDIGSFEVQEDQDQGEVIDFEGLPAGTVVTEVFSKGGFGPIQVRGKLDDRCAHNAAVVFDSSCPGGVCSGDDQDLGSPNATFGGPGQGKGGEMDSRWANDEPLGNLLIVHAACDELSGGVVPNPDDTNGGSTVTLTFPEPVRVLSYTIVDNERYERDKVNLVGKRGERLATLKGPATGNNGKAVVQTTSDGTGIGGVMRMIFKRKGSRGLDNIIFIPEG